jgi:hypothetical protein
MHRTLACVAVVALALTACGDDDGGSDADAQPYVDAVTRSLQGDEEFPVSDDTAACIGEAVVDAVGADRLEEAGVTPKEFEDAEDFDDLGIELTDDDIDRLGSGLAGCDLADAITQGFASELPGLTDGDLECISDGIDDDALGDAMAQGLLGGDDVNPEDIVGPVFDGLKDCPDAVTALLVDSIEQGSGEEVSEEGRACIQDEVADDTAEVVDLLLAGDTGTGGFPQRLEAACGDVLPGPGLGSG